MTIKDFIQSQLLDKSTGKYLKGRTRYDYLLKNYPQEYNAILNATRFLKSNEILLIRLWCILNNLTDYPKCECGSYLKWHVGQKVYGKFCSTKCTFNVKHVQSVKEDNCLKKYGVKHHWLVPEIAAEKVKKINLVKEETRKKINKTNLERYGGHAPLCSQAIQEKVKITNLKKYGVECALSLPKIKVRRKEVWKKDSNKIINKIKNSWAKKSELEIKNIVSKRRTTCLKKYNYSNPSQRPEQKERARVTATANAKSSYQKYLITCRKKYNRDNFQQSHLNPKIISFRQNKVKFKKWLEIQHYKLKRSQDEIASILNLDSAIINKSFKEFNLQTCYFQSSFLEKQISKYISTLGVSIKSRDRSELKGIELDIFIPSKKLAIEVNGIYWHSYREIPNKNEKLKHYYKTKACLNNNIQLLHILELQWKDNIKQNIWKSILEGKLLGFKNKIYARKTTLSIIPKSDISSVKEFYNNNHLYGFAQADIHLGLYFENKIVSCMSFKKLKDSEYELVRYASLCFYQILGGASKLFKGFVKGFNPTTVVTFADLNYSIGNIYKILGFAEAGRVAPRFSYTDKKKLINRRKYQKKQLPNLFGEGYDLNKTEIENVLKNTSYRIIWDSGKIKFVWYKIL
jgi:G:T-mismatch repair DNA endonuclease (very short patch repair protein)